MRMWPPGTNGAWYSSDSAQQTFSGNQVGTVTAIVPPGLSTRWSSAIAASRSGMCSSTSLHTMRSKVSSGNGRPVPSPFTAAAAAPAGTSPASSMAAKSPATSFSSAAS